MTEAVPATFDARVLEIERLIDEIAATDPLKIERRVELYERAVTLVRLNKEELKSAFQVIQDVNQKFYAGESS